jgi:hypothetical protein
MIPREIILTHLMIIIGESESSTRLRAKTTGNRISNPEEKIRNNLRMTKDDSKSIRFR